MSTKKQMEEHKKVVANDRECARLLKIVYADRKVAA